jgi:hypothetical protein
VRTFNLAHYADFNWISEIVASAAHIRKFIMNRSTRLSMFDNSNSLKLLAVDEKRFASEVVMLKRFSRNKIISDIDDHKPKVS